MLIIVTQNQNTESRAPLDRLVPIHTSFSEHNDLTEGLLTNYLFFYIISPDILNTEVELLCITS